jgi:glyoxylate/hydroxypyruvate reductase A
VLGWSRSPKAVDGVRTLHGSDGFAEFLSQTRVLINLLPLTPETENILNRENLGRLQAGAYVSTWRVAGTWWRTICWRCWPKARSPGPRWMCSARSLPAGHPFWSEPRITMTPHTSARTLRDESIAQIVGKVVDLSQGKPVKGMVDPQRGY